MTQSDKNRPPSDNSRVRPAHVGFLLTPGFAMLPYACAIEPLRAANRLSGRELYRWSHISVSGASAEASIGVRFPTDYTVGTNAPFDWVFVCAGGNPALFDDAATIAWLRRLARRKVRLGGVSGGPYILARAGLLEGYRFTIHWEHAPALAEEYPHLDLRRSLYEIDRDRVTSGGGAASLDMMHEIIAAEHGADLAVAVSEWFLQTHVREGGGPQRTALHERLGVASAPLLRAVRRMEQSLEHPLSRQDLAASAGVSLRQLERLFRRHLGRSLGEHQMELRLDHARHLLRQTGMAIIEIAISAGFASASHFSRAYKARFGHAPKAERDRVRGVAVEKASGPPPPHAVLD